MVKNIFSLVLMLLLSFVSITQDIETISKKDIIKVSGGIGVQTTAYTATGIASKRDPFLWQANLNLNFNILGIISAPFSATISSQQSQLSTPQPFNNFGISPKYKAFTAHLGYRSMNLSEFSLSGSQFLGVGLEVSPKESFVKGKALYGRFAKPVFFNPDGTIVSTPSFARFGWGAGLTFGKSAKHEVSINLFRAKDDPNSLNIPDEDLPITAAENLVFGITTKQEISKQISVEGEFDVSLYTNDATVQEEVSTGYSYINNLFLFGYNPTSELKKAVVAGVNYKPKFAKFQLKYRRVDPEYKTLGTSFINNDYEDLSLKTSFGLFKKKLAVSLSGGAQRNNLNADKVTKLLRLIGSASVSYTINDKWSTSVNYANFSSSSRQTIVIDLDSLRFVQTTKSAGFSLARSSSNDKTSNSLSFGFNYQDAIVNEKKTTEFYNTNIGWQTQLLKSKLSLGLSLVGMHNISEVGTSSNIGPSLNMSKSVFKNKIQLSFAAAYLNSFTNSQKAGSIINFALNGSYTIIKKIKLGFSVSDILKNIPTKDNSSELTATVNLNYSF